MKTSPQLPPLQSALPMPSRSVPDAGPAKTSDAAIIGGVVCIIGLVIAVGVWYPTIERHEREAAVVDAIAAGRAREKAQANFDLHAAVAANVAEEKRQLAAPLVRVWNLANEVPALTYPADRDARLAYLRDLNRAIGALQLDHGITEEDRPFADAVITPITRGYAALVKCDEDMLYTDRQEKAIKELVTVLAEVRESLPKALTALNERAEEKMK